jgi:hypothetical protein
MICRVQITAIVVPIPDWKGVPRMDLHQVAALSQLCDLGKLSFTIRAQVVFAVLIAS